MTYRERQGRQQEAIELALLCCTPVPSTTAIPAVVPGLLMKTFPSITMLLI